MTTPRDDNGKATDLADIRRAQILSAAVQVVGARGAANMRLADVADAAGTSIGLVQHYFRKRESLLLAAFDETLAQWYREFEVVATEDSEPARRLVRYLEQSVRSPRWPVWLEFWATAYREPALQARSAEHYDLWVAAFRTTIDDGADSGVFQLRKPAQDIADRLVAQIDGLALRGLLRHPSVPTARAIALLLEQLEADLGVDLMEHTAAAREHAE